MKALTICQPYAELIMLGEKRIENRTWPTSYRGPLVIHAGKSRDWLEDYGFTYPMPKLMEFGCLVGVVELVECVRKIPGVMRKLPKRLAWVENDPHACGPYLWIFENVERFMPLGPLEFRGKQNLFEVPDEVIDGVPLAQAGPRCRVCGCTNDFGCAEGCHWVEPDLCSSCEGE